MAAGSSPAWGAFPAETVDNIMQYLCYLDLKACRLVDKKFSREATMYLFQTLSIKQGREAITTKVLNTPYLAVYIRRLQYTGEARFKSALLAKSPRNITAESIHAVSLEHLNYIELASIFAGRSWVVKVIPKSKAFALMLSATAKDPSHRMQKTMNRTFLGFRRLPQMLPNLEDLKIGLGNAGTLDFDHKTKMSQYIFESTFQALRKLSMYGVPINAKEFVSFVKQHGNTLKTLVLENIQAVDLDATAPRNISFADGTVAILRFFILLARETKLETVHLDGTMCSYYPGFSGLRLGSLIRCCNNRGHLDPYDRASLRFRLEEFICGRAKFPFDSLHPYIDDLAAGKFRSDGPRTITNDVHRLTIDLAKMSDWSFDFTYSNSPRHRLATWDTTTAEVSRWCNLVRCEDTTKGVNHSPTHDHDSPDSVGW